MLQGALPQQHLSSSTMGEHLAVTIFTLVYGFLKVSKADMGREGRLERLAELAQSGLLHNLEDCAIRWELITLV